MQKRNIQGKVLKLQKINKSKKGNIKLRYIFKNERKSKNNDISEAKISIENDDEKSKENIINKKENFQIRTQLKLKNYLKIILFLKIMFLNIQILSNYKLHIIEFNFSNITLKIKGIGLKNIFSTNFNYYPDIIYINGNQQNIVNESYYFNQTESFVKLVWNNNLNDSSYLFSRCSDIVEINLAYFDTTQVADIGGMFYSCSSLTSITFDNFDTSKVTDMNALFYECSSLTSINLSNFNTSNAKRMQNMFHGCILIKSLDFSNFNTTSLTDMKRMFFNCTSLTSLDLSNFETSQVNTMSATFYGCKSLSSLNLSNFNTSKLKEMGYFLASCTNLEYINLENFEETNLRNFDNIFNDVPENLVICINENKTNERIFPQIKNKSCFTIDCSNNWKLNQKFLTQENDKCINKCYLDLEYKYEYNGKCLKNCSNGFFTDENNITKCKCGLEQCLSCPKIDLFNNFCIKCNYNFYPIENDPLNVGKYINCYKEPKGYYLDSKDSIYKKCYYKCETCKKQGNENNNNCIKCKDNYTCDIIPENETDFINEVNSYDEFLRQVEKNITSENYDLSNIDSGEDEYKKYKNLQITITTTDNQRKNINVINQTNIDLGTCEVALKNHYNISINDTLYIKKLEIKQEGMRIPKIEFDIYFKFSKKYLEKLNLTICENIKISFYLPVSISEDLDKLNISSGYFNDKCYPTTSEFGTDMTLKDRKEDFIKNNKTVCQENCDFSEYLSSIQKAKCLCKVEESSSHFDLMKINITRIYQSFKDYKNIINLNILVCYKRLFCKSGLSENVASYILIAIIAFHFISIFVFYLKELPILKNKIEEIIIFLKKIKLENGENEETKNKIIINEIEKKEEKNDNNEIIMPPPKETIKKKFKRKKRNKKRSDSRIITDSQRPKADLIIMNENNNNINEALYGFNMDNHDNVINENSNKKNQDENKKNKNEIEYTDDEINEFSYDIAIKHDKRTYFQYYISLLKTKHDIIFTFFYSKDYNARTIKIELFFIGFTLNYTVNALFYDDESFHKLFEFEGSFDFLYQIPKIILSSLISMILNIVIKYFSLSNDDIIKLKQNKKKSPEDGVEFMRKLKFKFILYFIISFIVLLFFWYYLSMFGAIYKNTQYHLLIDTLISLVLSFIYPFGIYLLPGLFRIPALSNTKKERVCLYKISQLFQML